MPKLKKNPYREWLKQDFGTLIEALNLSELQKHFLRSRWLDQVLWMEGRADSARDWYYRLRLTTIICGAVITALAGINTGSGLASINTGDQSIGMIIKAVSGWVIFFLSLVVTISAAVEGFFHYGERWRHYRRTVELLKIEGWQFFQLSGSYSSHASHIEAYRIFAAQVENIIQQDVEVYITKVVREQEEQKQKDRLETQQPHDDQGETPPSSH